MAVTSKRIKTSDAKKEMKKELAGKIEAALPELKQKLGEKKFQSRTKKAAKILLHGLNDKQLNTTPNTDIVKLTPNKTKAPKKVKVKNQSKNLPSKPVADA